MSNRRKSKAKSYKLSQYEPTRKRATVDLVDTMLDDFNDNFSDPNVIVPLNEKCAILEKDLLSRSYILIGPTYTGKSSLISWALRNEANLKMITIDCRLYETDSQFIQYMTRQIGAHINDLIDKKIVINETINFKELNNIIAHPRDKDGPMRFVIVIKYAEKLAEQKKQLLLYTIFEWLNNTTIRQHLTIVLTTRLITFSDKLEKRIRSRISSSILWLGRPTPSKIIQILVRRVEYRMERCERSDLPKLQQLKKALSVQKLQNLLKEQYEHSPESIVYYLKIMRLILTLDLETDQKWSTFSQENINKIVLDGFKFHSHFLMDYRRISLNIFTHCSYPEIILMGLIRKNFLRQKEGHSVKIMNFAQLLNEFNEIKSRAKTEIVGTSFFYTEAVMSKAYEELNEKKLISIKPGNSLRDRDMYCQFGPEDIEDFYRRVETLPSFINEIFESIYHED